MKIEESLNVSFDETPPPSNTSPLVDDDVDEEEAIKVTEKKNLENDIEDETLEIDEVVNINLCHCLLTLSFLSEIFKSLSFRLDRLCHIAILCLDQHAHTLHHLESLLTISLDRLDIFEGRSCISEFVRKFKESPDKVSAQSVGSSNTDVFDLPVLVLITERLKA
ncbi:hypothetical protein Tco_0247754 [Tanacetum coccineum]